MNSVLLVNSTIEFRNTSSGLYLSMEWIQRQSLRDNLFNPWNGKEVPRWWLLRYRKWVPQQLGDEAVMQLPCYQTREWGQPTNGSMARRHCDTWTYYICCRGVVDRSVFAVQAWSNLWDLIWEPPSHYSMCQSDLHYMHSPSRCDVTWSRSTSRCHACPDLSTSLRYLQDIRISARTILRYYDAAPRWQLDLWTSKQGPFYSGCSFHKVI